MINRQELLKDLQSLLRSLEADLLERSDSAEVPEVSDALEEEYAKAKEAERTARNYEDWRSDYVTQIAAAWVLGCVFARFLEDNQLVELPKIAGPGKRLSRARDEHQVYFTAHPTETDREYLLALFDELAKLPGAEELFGEHHPVGELPHWLSGDAAGELLRFFRRIDADSGALVHDFTDHDWDTRFLGDLYQDLSEAARKKYALLQTPEFVEEFILDRTLDPAIDQFGLDDFKMIDPACGSGHFLLGSFPRLLDRWQKKEPGTPVRELTQRALDTIHGVDVNPFAVAITRFRMLLAALRACGIRRLSDAPAFQMNVVCGDSLLHGSPGGDQTLMAFHDMAHAYHSEDIPALRKILAPGRYHAVVANPPYITPKDRALNQAYRQRFSTCHMKYSLAVPFMQRIFNLAVDGGMTGQITANSFMKREFGKKLIEQFLPKIDLTHVIDTSGAYIPGHGTPTTILFGRNRKPIGDTLRTVMGIRGEPATPKDPAHGLVWSAIVAQIDQPDSESEFISVGDSSRELFAKHPWSIGGGGAAELKVKLEQAVSVKLSQVADAGVAVVTLEDEAYQLDRALARRTRIPHECFRGFVIGDTVRDWQLSNVEPAIFPHDRDTFDPIEQSTILHCLWPLRTCLVNRLWFRKNMSERGMKWFAYGHISVEKFRTPLSIVYGEIATHNHFVLDRGGKVFNRTAPVIKLPPEASEDDHLALLGLLNSSTACFWMKQVCFPKGGDHVGQEGARVRRSLWDERHAFNATNLEKMPLAKELPLALSRQLDEMAGLLTEVSPSEILWKNATENNAAVLAERQFQWEGIRQQMIALQEELDWQCYRLYGLTEEELVSCQSSVVSNEGEETDHCELKTENFIPIELGQRAFEIVMARKMAAGELQTTWFERHGSKPITQIPDHWPKDYKNLVQWRIERIETDKNIRLIEQPEYKRRWNTEPWESQVERALREALLNLLESYFDFDGRMREVVRGEGVVSEEGTDNQELKTDNRQLITDTSPPPLADIHLVSIARLADIAAKDSEFMQLGELYRDDSAFDVQNLVEELVASESVPLLPILRYKPAGLRKREQWEKTWELQREEDRLSDRMEVVSGEEVFSGQSSVVSEEGPDSQEPTTDNRQLTTPIPVPPKYKSSDFISSGGVRYWRLRGKLDVPKERWTSFPHCEGEDGTLMIAWAGYDHLQLARAVSAYYVDVQERLGGRDDARLIPLLACLIELLPWLKQWHNAIDPEFGMAMGDYFEGFVSEEARQMGKTVEEIKAWQPPKKTKRKASRKK